MPDEVKFVAIQDASVGEFAVSSMIILLGVVANHSTTEEMEELVNIAKSYHLANTEEEKMELLIKFGTHIDKCCKASLEKQGEEIQ